MRTFVFILVMLSTACFAVAEPTGRWVITFKDAKEAAQRCDFSPARLWISRQSAVINFDGGRPPRLAKVVMDLKKSPVAELSFNSQDGGDILMSGFFGAGSARGTWKSLTRACEGTWTAHTMMDLRAPELIEIRLKTMSGPCPRDMPPARIWFQAQSPLAVEDAAGQSKPYRRAEVLSLFSHLWEYLLETADGEHLHVWRSGGFGPERSEWTSLSRECKGNWTMTRISQ